MTKYFTIILLLSLSLCSTVSGLTEPSPTAEETPVQATVPVPVTGPVKAAPLPTIPPADTAIPTLPATDTAAPTEGPYYPFPQHLTYAPGTLRPNHRTQTQQDEDARAFYDYWKATYLMEAGTTPGGYPLYRVSYGATNPARTVSEGQGYGMIIVALMAGYDAQAQVYFDGLWEFSRAHPSDIDPRLMGWQVPPDETGNDSAFDGDADIAYGLLLADAQWGSGGRINYQAEVEQVITAILESTIGPDSRLPMLGDWVEIDDETHNQYTPRSSDFMPAHFRAYGRTTGDTVWNQVVSSVRIVIDSLQANYSPATGLLPDFIVPTSSSDHTPKPAPPDFLEGPHDGHYDYNAARDPWRIGTDALLNNDGSSLLQMRKISTWIETATSGDPQNIRAGYKLNGDPVADSDYFSTVFAAPFGVAAMCTPGQQTWLNAVYDSVSQTHQDYFEDTVTLLCLLLMTGNYWDPTTIDPGPPAPTAYLMMVLQ